MKKLMVSFLIGFSLVYGNSLEVNFNNISTHDLIKITSKVIGKNIFYQEPIEGKVGFVLGEKIDKENILSLLSQDLLLKGYNLVENNSHFIIQRKTVLQSNNIEMDIFFIKNHEAKHLLEQLMPHIETLYAQKKEKKPSLSADQKNNSLVVMGKEKDIRLIKEMIQKIDIPQRQVYVRAKILEISKVNTENMGLRYGLQGFNAAGATLTALSSSLNGLGAVTPLGLEGMAEYGYSPLNLKHGLSLGVAINLLNQNKALDVISEPSLLCINNQKSSIYVGETRAIATGTTVGTTTTTNYQREDIGLKLSVTPRIAQNNKVTLKIDTILEDIKETQISLNGMPNTDKKEIITTAIVENGESVVLGGLIKNKLENVTDSIPFLGDIPLLGALFTNQHTIDDKVNLVIIITPHIVPLHKDLTFVRDQLAKMDLLTQKATDEVIELLEK